MWLFLMDVVISDLAVAIAPLALISRAFWNIWKFFEYFFFSFFFFLHIFHYYKGQTFSTNVIGIR